MYSVALACPIWQVSDLQSLELHPKLTGGEIDTQSITTICPHSWCNPSVTQTAHHNHVKMTIPFRCEQYIVVTHRHPRGDSI